MRLCKIIEVYFGTFFKNRFELFKHWYRQTGTIYRYRVKVTYFKGIVTPEYMYKYPIKRTNLPSIAYVREKFQNLR